MNANDIHQILSQAFQPQDLTVTDDGARHKRHKEAQLHGGGHFVVHIVSEAFEGKSAIERHQMIYQAMHMPHPKIHALSIVAKTLKEISCIAKTH